MQTQIKTLDQVVFYAGELITDVYSARNIFFSEDLRTILKEVYEEFSKQINTVERQLKNSQNSNKSDLEKAGLVGAQRKFKLKSFEISFNSYRKDGKIKRLIEALKKAKTLISSIGGAIPAVGSFIQELIDFILRELEKKS